MQAVHLRKYGEATNINFELFEVDGIDFRVDAVHASGDSAIMKDNGAEANTASGFLDEGNGYSLALSATELQAARIVLYLVDQTATKVWLDKSIVIETYGHASAQHAFDLDTASTAQTADHTAGIADIPTVAEFNARTLLAASYFDPATDTVANVTTVATTTDKAGYTISGTKTTLDSLDDITSAEVNAEMVDVIETDTHAEPSSAVGAVSSIKDALMWVKTLLRNKMTSTSTTATLRNDGDSADIATSTHSDDSTTFTRGKYS